MPPARPATPGLHDTPSSVQMLAQIGDMLTTPSRSVLNIANLGGESMGWTASASPSWIVITPTAAGVQAR